MTPTLTIPLSALLAVLAIMALRIAWGRQAQGRLIMAGGWSMLALSMVVAAAGAGAWGMAVASLWAMGTALCLVAVAAWRSQPPARPVRHPARSLPPAKPGNMAGPVITFLIIAIGALLAAIALALGGRWLAVIAGAGAADANVTMLFLLPVAWAILAYAILALPSRGRQLGLIAACLAVALPVLP